MSSKPSSTVLKCSCDKIRGCLRSTTSKKSKIKLPKKVVVSKKWHQNCSHDPKSQSAGIIESRTVKYKKTTKSESTVDSSVRTGKTRNLDFCRKCGDTDIDMNTAESQYSGTGSSKNRKSDIVEKQNMIEFYKNDEFKDYTAISHLTSKTKRITIRTEGDAKSDKNVEEEEGEPVEEYYRNDKFQYQYDSMHDIDNNGVKHVNTLDTITEVNEKQIPSDEKSSKTTIKSSKSTIKSSKSTVSVEEASDEETNSVKELKEFRDKNYFECHSAKSRVDKINANGKKKHKCSYRFYLNDRLFPVAVNRDYNDNIRCVDCHLPLDLASKEGQANGTIQAKVKVGTDTQDSMLILPVEESLIIKQRKKDIEKIDSKEVYFGVIKLDRNGNSLVSRSLPYDSLALKYQKGYRELSDMPSYRYDKLEEGDVIVI